MILNLGFTLKHEQQVSAQGLRYGENHEVRFAYEWLYTFEKAA